MPTSTVYATSLVVGATLIYAVMLRFDTEPLPRLLGTLALGLLWVLYLT